MSEARKSLLDEHLRLRLADLPWEQFERFFLHFLNAGISLSVEREGARVERRIIEANLYAAGTGRKDDGVDLVARVEGGETWAFQCKRVQKWNEGLTKAAIEKAAGFPAQHYFLLVACEPHQKVQKLITRYPKWSFWDLDKICAEFRLRVPRSRQLQVLSFLQPEEIRRFAPYANDAFISPGEYLSAVNRGTHAFHHRYPLVGRERELTELTDFASTSEEKVLLLSARGGEGKSRLLWEFARSFEKSNFSTEVLFLNPHSSSDVPSALWDSSSSRLLIVDDAHRLERVSHELLTCAREGSATKLILATRPQGDEAIEERLREHGLWSRTRKANLHKLKKVDIKELAKGALGEEWPHLVEPLTGLTGDSPFLTALAGDLLRRRVLTWGSWSSPQEFYSTVLQSFERDNLSHLAPGDRETGSRLLKIIALLTPVSPDSTFFERAAECLSISALEVETIYRRLQAAGIVSSEKQNVRVIPDLFSDFLAFETAFDPTRRVPVLTSKVLEVFSEQSAALLRNLSEAAWLARTENIESSELIRPLLEAEFRRFDSLGFYERAQMLEEWSAFSVYLPGESIELARKAIAQDSTSPDRREVWQMYLENFETHEYTKSWVPRLLKPVASWCGDFRDEALDVLWELGKNTPNTFINGNKNHPWEVIAEVSKFEPHKDISVSRSVLEWIDRVVRRSSTRTFLESPGAILSTLLSPAFERHVHFTEWHGRTMRWWEQPVNIERTTELRDHALRILCWVVENRSWVAAVQVIGTLEYALHRVGPADVSNVRNAEKFREAWRPERLKALEIFPKILARHSQVAVRFAIRRWILQDVAYEEDDAFKARAREILESVREDFDLRLAISLLTEGHYEFAEELGKPSGAEFFEESKKLWSSWNQRLATEFISAYPEIEAGIAQLQKIAGECFAAGYTPRFISFFPAVSEMNESYAVELAENLIESAHTDNVSSSWYQLLFGMASGEATHALIEKASNSQHSEIRTGAIHFLCFRDRGDASLNPAERTLIETLAAHAGESEIAKLLQLVQWLDAENASWGFALLERLPLKSVAKRFYPDFLSALFPYRARKAAPSPQTVSYVFEAMVSAPEIEVDRSDRPFQRLLEGYPREVYEFVIARLRHAETTQDSTRYHPLPRTLRRRFRLASLSNEADYESICGFLWDKAVEYRNDFAKRDWLVLFQGVVLENRDFWIPRLKGKIEAAKDVDDLRSYVSLIGFDGSLIIFREPAIASAFLSRAEDLDGIAGMKKIRTSLYHASGPEGRSFSNGDLDSECDYLEAEAFKAAEAHAADEVLGPFYRWIAEVERHDREFHRKLYEAEMASLDEE